MGRERLAARVKLFAGLIYADTSRYSESRRLLERVFGRSDYESAELDFTHTDYYEPEMGRALKRRFISFGKPADPEGICKVKLVTNRIEKRLSTAGKRLVNIDPGYLDLSKLVLFTTKDYSHRIYLGKSIYAENTLYYKDGSFRPWPWTYPDYGTKEYAEIFESIRDIFKSNTGC